MTTIKRITKLFSITALAVGMIGLTIGSANAAELTIRNPGFEEADGSAGRGNLHNVHHWTEENAASVFVDDAGTAYKPQANRCLYLGAANTAVNQDLDARKTWASDDVFTIGLIGQNAGWVTGTTEFKVQLRQTDGTVLWDSGAIDVTGTVINNNEYAGTNHIHSWTVDASTFSGAGVVEGSQINIRIAYVTGTPYIDDVTLEDEKDALPSVGGDLFLEDLNLAVAGYEGSIQWEQSSDGSSWSEVGGAIFTELNVTTLYAATPWFRVKATSGANPPAYSEAMKVTVEDTPEGKLVRIN